MCRGKGVSFAKITERSKKSSSHLVVLPDTNTHRLKFWAGLELSGQQQRRHASAGRFCPQDSSAWPWPDQTSYWLEIGQFVRSRRVGARISLFILLNTFLKVSKDTSLLYYSRVHQPCNGVTDYLKRPVHISWRAMTVLLTRVGQEKWNLVRGGI